MQWKKHHLSVANAPLRLIGARLVPGRDYDQLDRLREGIANPLTFQLGGTEFHQFAHRYNCGWPFLATATERSVELALADRWLELVDPEAVIEIGAVTPYYWPRRVQDVLDPTDQHAQVRRRASLFDVDLSGRPVLSISTFEHIGIGDYGLDADPPLAGRALDKLFAESPAFLVTFASGYNDWLDAHLTGGRNFPDDVGVRLLTRNLSGVGWAECLATTPKLRPYSSAGGNAVFVLHRGTALFGGTA